MYASIFKASFEEVMEKEKFIVVMGADDGTNKLEHLGIVLPSDPAWRTENYFRLVELHRSKTGNQRITEKTIPRKIFKKGYPALGLWALRSSEKRELTAAYLTVDSEPVIHWNEEELIAASGVLTHLDHITIFSEPNPDRMRKILGLVYDVLRYKNVLREVLEDIQYYNQYPMDIQHEKKVWLLLYDMICWGFRERKDKIHGVAKEEIWKEGLEELHGRLWESKVQIAANIARVRIRKQARCLADLLPRRVRLPSRVVSDVVVQGWINVYRIPYTEIGERFKRLGLTRHVGREALPPLTFSEDHLLQYHYYCRPFTRSTFLNSELVNNRDFIIESRTHSISAAVVIEVMKNKELIGSVVQTEVVALPASGYIAALLFMNKQLRSHLIIFGAGDKKEEYKTYFEELGVSNVCVFSDDFTSVEPEDPRLLGVVLVLASPPSSYSGVLDPVDLAISRGGDVQLLKVLTDRAEDDQGPDPSFLIKQRKTLQRALSIPQVQGVIYETYSEFDQENIELAKSAVQEMNDWAAQKHFKETLAEVNESGDQVIEPLPTEIEVPVCDLYDLTPLPDICPQESNCLSLREEGVYIALIMRKKITRLDSKFMISMAEERGLFGTGNKENYQEMEKIVSEERRSSSTEKRQPKAEINIKRISEPTFCSKLKRIQASKTSFCERSRNKNQLNIPRLWWKVLFSYLLYSKQHHKIKRRLFFPRRNTYFYKRKKNYRLGNTKIILSCCCT